MSTANKLDELIEEECRKFHAKDVSELSGEAFIYFAETVLESIAQEVNHTLMKINGDYESDEAKEIIGKTERFLLSPYYNAVSMGHGMDALENFRAELELIKQGKWGKAKNSPVKDWDMPESIGGKFKSTRDKMIAYRKMSGKSIHQMARYCQCSEGLLRLVENGSVTHPDIANRIASIYKLTKKEAEDLVPIHHRSSNPEYDPDKYRSKEDGFQRFAIVDNREPVDIYISERRSRAAKNHESRGYY